MIENELMTIESSGIIDLFKKKDGIKPILEEIEKNCKSFVFDATTKQGRKDAKSLARKVSNSKGIIVEAGKKSVEDLKEIVSIADRQRIDAEKFLDNLRDEVKREAVEWEAKEEQRVTSIKARIKTAHEACTLVFTSIEMAQDKLIQLGELSKLDFQEMKDEASVFFTQATENITKEIARLEREEKERLELEQLRREKEEREEKERQDLIEKERVEREERIKKEAEERARIEAENKAREEKERLEKEAQDAIARENEAKERAARAEQEILDAKKREEESAKRAKIEQEEAVRRAEEAERKRVFEEEQRKIAEQKKREADIEHRKKINNEALADIMSHANIVESEARLVIAAIAKGQCRHLVIRY